MRNGDERLYDILKEDTMIPSKVERKIQDTYTEIESGRPAGKRAQHMRRQSAGSAQRQQLLLPCWPLGQLHMRQQGIPQYWILLQNMTAGGNCRSRQKLLLRQISHRRKRRMAW